MEAHVDSLYAILPILLYVTFEEMYIGCLFQKWTIISNHIMFIWQVKAINNGLIIGLLGSISSEICKIWPTRAVIQIQKACFIFKYRTLPLCHTFIQILWQYNPISLIFTDLRGYDRHCTVET